MLGQPAHLDTLTCAVLGQTAPVSSFSRSSEAPAVWSDRNDGTRRNSERTRRRTEAVGHHKTACPGKCTARGRGTPEMPALWLFSNAAGCGGRAVLVLREEIDRSCRTKATEHTIPRHVPLGHAWCDSRLRCGVRTSGGKNR